MALEINDINGLTITGGTFYSAGTPLQNIIQTISSSGSGNGNGAKVQNGLNTYTGGTSSLPTVNISAATLNNITVTGDSSFTTFSATSIFSSSTEFNSIFKTKYLMEIPMYADPTLNITLTNQAVAAQFFQNSFRYNREADLSDFTHCRLVVGVISGSSSVNNPRLRVVTNSTNDIGTPTNWANIGVAGAEVSCSLATPGLIDSNWQTMSATARTDVFLSIVQIGGDAAADPIIGSAVIYFK